MVADWARSPVAALEHFLSMPYEEQIALEYVINWNRRTMQDRAAELLKQLEAEYAASAGNG